MMYFVTKATRLNLRITPAFRADLEALADHHGLSLSSYAHSLLVKAVRKELQDVSLEPRVARGHSVPSVSKSPGIPYPQGKQKKRA